MTSSDTETDSKPIIIIIISIKSWTVSSQNGRSQNGRVPKRPCVDQPGNLLVGPMEYVDYWFTRGRFGTRIRGITYTGT